METHLTFGLISPYFAFEGTAFKCLFIALREGLFNDLLYVLLLYLLTEMLSFMPLM